MSRYGFLAAALAASAAAQAVPAVDSATGITFATYKEETTGAQFGLVTPETFTGDFIGQMIAPTGNSTGWVGMSLAPSMLNNLLVTAWPNDDEIVSSFRKATDYAPPAPFPAGNITATPIAKGTFVNSTHYSYTFLCSGCLSVQPNWQGDVTGTGIGWALSTNTLGNTASANATLNFHNAGQGIFILSFVDAQSPNFAEYAALAGSDTTPTDPDGGNDDGEDEGTPAPTSADEPPFPTGTGEAPLPTGTDEAPFPTTTFDPVPTATGSSSATRTRNTRSRSTRTRSTRTRRPRPTATGDNTPTAPDAEDEEDESSSSSAAAPTGTAPTSTRTRATRTRTRSTRTRTSQPTATGDGGSGGGDDEGEEPSAPAPTGSVPSPTRRPRPSKSKSTKTKSSKTRGSSGAARTAASAPFRPAFNPDVAKGNDFEEAQRFKASFLDGYYKGSE